MSPFDVQCGVVTVAQALACMSRGQVRARVAAGRWQRPHHGVLVTHNGPLTWEQELWVCLLAAPPGSALAGPTAAQLDGLLGLESRRPWIVVPYGRRKPQRGGVVVLQSRHLGDDDVHPERSPRRTRIERSILDMSTNAVSAKAARVPVLAAVQQALTVPEKLRAALARRATCSHRALIAETIDDAEGGVHSLPEREFAQILRGRRLPAPVRQRRLRRPDGRYYLDADWDTYDLSVEIHGLPHLEIRNWDADLDRHNELSIDGRRLLQFASYAVRHHPGRVADQVERGLSRGGL
ncbi:hypothetical protein [Haloechinothrix salitolerans]|uniref:DUF559 domain-containing protein n=1 Tax=Haloechinothrix salitolerans TaxID=926830 RepID=A0ABW2C3C8_9PSEU